jgi:hypothetical protein
MAIPAQTGHHHLFRFTGIEIHLEALPWGEGFQGKPAADEVERTGRSAQIQHLIRLEGCHGQRCPKSRANSPLL